MATYNESITDYILLTELINRRYSESVNDSITISSGDAHSHINVSYPQEQDVLELQDNINLAASLVSGHLDSIAFSDTYYLDMPLIVSDNLTFSDSSKYFWNLFVQDILSILDSNSTDFTAYSNVTDLLKYSDDIKVSWNLYKETSISFSDSVLFPLILSGQDNLSFISSAVIKHKFDITVADSLNFLSLSFFGKSLQQIIGDQFNLSDALGVTSTIHQIVENQLKFLESVDVIRGLIFNLVDSLSLQEQVLFRVDFLLSDSFTLADNATSTSKIVEAVADIILFDAIASYAHNLIFSISDAFNLQDSNTNTLDYSISVEDVISFISHVFLPSTDGKAIVMNLAKQRFSEYQNYDFNSFCTLDDEVYGANDLGIFKMEGEKDNNSNISASMAFNASDFGIQKEKRVKAVYIGQSSSGCLVLKVSTEDEKTRYYEVKQNQKTHTQKVPMSLNAKSRYWKFDLVNSNGGDIQIHEISFMPVIMARWI